MFTPSGPKVLLLQWMSWSAPWYPAGGGIGFVPTVIGSTVGVAVERRTNHRATDLPC